MLSRVRCRRSSAIIVSLEGNKAIIHAYIANKKLECGAEILTALMQLNEWRPIRPFVEQSGMHPEDMLNLVEQGIVLIEGSPEDQLEGRYKRDWQWGKSAAYYYFSVRNTQYLDGEESLKWIKARAKAVKSPALCDDPSTLPDIRLPEFISDTQLRSTLYARRTERRQNSRSAIDLKQLGDILFSGFGIVAFYDFEGYGRLPLKMSPSGGARNPYEAYVVADRVVGLEPGIYRYSSLQHGLSRIAPVCDRCRLLANQEWAADTAVTIVLVANFERSWWKYPFPAAFRPVLIEAGHIVQNCMLMATESSLACVPTSAINDEYADEVLSLDKLHQSAVYSVSIGRAFAKWRNWQIASRRPARSPIKRRLSS